MENPEGEEKSSGNEIAMKRNTWILAAVLVVLAALTYIVLQKPGERSLTGTEGDPIVECDSALVDRLEIQSAKGHLVLRKEGDEWKIISPISYRAADHMALKAAETPRTTRLKSLVSTNPDKQGLFQVDSTGILVRVFQQGVEKGAFRIGKTTTSFAESYIRREGSNDVYIADGVLSGVYDRKAEDWRDKGIYRTSRDAITSVTLNYGDTTIAVVRQDTVWTMNGKTIGEPTSFLAAVAKIETETFVDTTITRLPPLSAVLTVDGTAIRFHFDKDTQKYFVLSSSSPQWFSIPLWRAKQLLKREKDFPPKP
jgi:hypothetical protein